MVFGPDKLGGATGSRALAARATRATKHVVLRLWLCLVVTGALAVSSRDAPAQDVGAARRDVTEADDFRVRVSAALTLGKSHGEGVRPLLEQALSDGHPAVRTAAAAALAAYGDPAAIPALERLSGDASASVKAQAKASIATLQKVAQNPWLNARYVVQLGDMKNRRVRGKIVVRI